MRGLQYLRLHHFLQLRQMLMFCLHLQVHGLLLHPLQGFHLAVENTGITVEKTANKSYITANGEDVEFTIKVTNNSSRGISDLVVTDNLPQNLTYVENSTSVNGANPINADPTGGIYIGNLRSGATATVKFNVTVNI